MISSAVQNADKITIELVPTATDDVRGLIRELDQELAQEYTSEQRHGLTLDAIFQPHVRFFLADWMSEPVGCGGVALFADFAEVKRMFVRNTVRGRGVAKDLLRRIEPRLAMPGSPYCGWRRETARLLPCAFINKLVSKSARRLACMPQCPLRPSRPASSWKNCSTRPRLMPGESDISIKRARKERTFRSPKGRAPVRLPCEFQTGARPPNVTAG